MSKDIIKSIIKGKKVTGDDVGRLLLADMAEEYKNYLKTGQVKSIISQDDFNKLLNSLPTSLQIERYNHYVSIHNTIKTYFTLNKGTAGEVRSRIKELHRILEALRTSIQARISRAEMPLIVTQKQYDKLVEEYEPPREEKYNYMDIFLHTETILIDTYNDLKGDTEPRPEVEALINKYDKELAENPDLIKAYKLNYEPTGEDGYFTFKRPDQPVGASREEFFYNLAIRNIKPLVDADQYSKKELQKPVDERFIYEVLTPEQVDEHIEYELYSKPPEKVYKSDIMKAYFIKDLYTEDKITKDKLIKLFTLYCEELPELVSFIKKDLQKYKCLKPYKDIQPKDWLKPIITMDELLRDGVADFRSWGLYAFRDDYPRAYNGVAILKDEIYNTYDKENIIDKEGNYIEPDISIMSCYDDAYLEAIKEGGQEGINAMGGLYSTLKMVYAYNEFIKIIAKVCNLPSIEEAFIYDLKPLESEVREYNTLLYIMLNCTLNIYGGKGHYKEAKELRDNIFKVLPYIDMTRAEVTPEDREKGEEFISDINNFKGISAVSRPFYILSGCGD